ncbi:(Na+)-NQR maturation NqrM [Congregibacter variabilis]|uniref:(Na+)-NQR maturation NqrM n=1 Tax=Congregibacter variabilis TaxID=3081200 RepID=A0ABZ0I3X9_9GAMM|nr:(Na+)-NQR maturation NqrM [Congregibacter sp. IMCC43200]
MVFVLAFLIMGLIMAGMAIGAMAGRGPLKGSCGGLSAVGIEGRCDICGDDPSLCETQSKEGPRSVRDDGDARFYDASK